MTVTVSGTTGVNLTDTNSVATAAIQASAVTPAKLSQPLTLGTSQNTTSGTSIDFTSIPSWVKRISVLFNGVSTSGTANVQLQVGSGSITTTGYNGTYWFSGGGGGTFTTGFGVSSSSASDLRYGAIVLTHMGSNLWAASGSVGLLTAGITSTCGATVQLSGALDRIRLTTVGGTDTFDAGSVNILYE